MQFMAHNMNRKISDPTPEARLSFYLAFGYTPEQQLAIEDHYDRLNVQFDTPLKVPFLMGDPRMD
jgi:hypothetical protein